MTKLTKEQLIEDLKASTQNASGMFEISEDTICALMSMLAATPAPVSVPDEAYSDDCPDLYPSQPDAWAEGWNQCRAAMLQGAEHSKIEMLCKVLNNAPLSPSDNQGRKKVGVGNDNQQFESLGRGKK